MPSLEIKSVDSIPPIRYRQCEKKVEMPWDKISLPNEDTYVLKDSRPIVVPTDSGEKLVPKPKIVDPAAQITPAKAGAFACSCDCCQDQDIDDSGCSCSDCVRKQAQQGAAEGMTAAATGIPEPTTPDGHGPTCMCVCCQNDVDTECTCDSCVVKRQMLAASDPTCPAMPPAALTAASGRGSVTCCSCGCAPRSTHLCPKKPKPRVKKRAKDLLKEHCAHDGPFLYTNEMNYAEPYMEELYMDFNPEEFDEDEGLGKCGSKTEMPWHDILIPGKVVIHKVMPKTDEACSCT